MILENDLEKLVERIESKLILGKLDSLILFVPTIFGAVFAVAQYYLKTIEPGRLLSTLIPLLLVAVALPIYVGYYRGAIGDSIAERARGWIYLLGGFLMCVWMTVIDVIGKMSWPYSFPVLFVGSLFIGYVFERFIPRRVGRGIFGLVGKIPTPQDEIRFFLTGLSAYILVFLGFLVAIYPTLTFGSHKLLYTIPIGVMGILAVLFLFTERYARTGRAISARSIDVLILALYLHLEVLIPMGFEALAFFKSKLYDTFFVLSVALQTGIIYLALMKLLRSYPKASLDVDKEKQKSTE